MPPLDDAELVALMDRNLVAICCADTRATPGGVVTEEAGLVLCRTPRGTLGTNMTLVTGPTSAAAVRAATARTYDPTGQPFSVWTREHADADLAHELRAAGFTEIHREPAMVLLPGAGTPPPAAAGIDVRPVTTDAERATYADVMARAYAVYGVPEESTAEHFALLASLVGPTTQAFLAWSDGHAVAGATLYLAHDVGGVGWVGTLPDAGRRGYGAAVTWRAVEEGRRRGVRFLNLQASPMGAPLYTRLGFVTPTHYRWFLAPT